MSKFQTGTLVKLNKNVYGSACLKATGPGRTTVIINHKFVLCEVMAHHKADCCDPGYCSASRLKLWVPLLKKYVTVYKSWIKKLNAKPIYGVGLGHDE